jgi:hypothetical protein
LSQVLYLKLTDVRFWADDALHVVTLGKRIAFLLLGIESKLAHRIASNMFGSARDAG